jgi:uncharacterized DUF497 family protein
MKAKTNFEWDPEKDRINRKIHGISFLQQNLYSTMRSAGKDTIRPIMRKKTGGRQ